MDEKFRRELQEAIDIGDLALNELQQALKCLESAKRWGYIDIFGGGMVVSLVKHAKTNKASIYMEQAKRDLHVFIRELRDVEWIVPDIEMGNLLTVADLIFDGIFADVLMQTRIEKAVGQVREAIIRVDAILTRLYEKLKES